MSSADTPERDPVDELLTVGRPADVDRIRPRIMAQTMSVLHRRRLARRLAAIAALAGCYLAGMATTQALREFSGQPGGSVVRTIAPGQPAPRPPDRLRERELGPPGRLEAGESAIAQADFNSIWRAGDRHLHEKGDVLAALDDYVQALDRATAEELTVSYEDDSFLLAALKLARIEENRNENDGT